VERLLELHPELRGVVVFVQLVQKSRGHLGLYREERQRMLLAAERVNQRFGEGTYQPVVLLEGSHDMAMAGRYFRAADVFLVASLHDAMNLESKQFIASRDDEAGVLVLSGYAGATFELVDALVVDPLDVDETAAALAAALAMPRDEQRLRMQRLRSAVAAHDALRWGRTIIADTLVQRQEHAAATPEVR
jgi:trehalose 6-phosphate synthase